MRIKYTYHKKLKTQGKKNQKEYIENTHVHVEL